MAMRSHTHKKPAKGSVAVPVKASSKSRPFAPPAKPDLSRTMADVQAQLEHAQRYGHSLSKMSLSPRPSAPPMIQPKLTIGAPGDKYEQEADRVAQQVVQRLNAPQSTQSEQSVQRETLPEEEDELQMKSRVQRSSNGAMAASEDLESAIAQSRGRGQPLTDTIRQPMEQAFGADFSGVRVHTDNRSEQLNRSIQARAFTTGQDVFFRQGTYQPGNRGGQELIAHELTHVMQQNREPALAPKQTPVGSKLSPTTPGLLQCMSFTRFDGFFGFFQSHNTTEKQLLALEKQTGKVLAGLQPYFNNELYGEQLQNLQQQFQDIKNGTYANSEYKRTQIDLQSVFDAADAISTEIANQKLRDEQELGQLIDDSFDVVDNEAEVERPNQISQAKLIEITSLLNDIYFENESNLAIAPDISYGTYNLAQRSNKLDKSVPPEIAELEATITQMGRKRKTIQRKIDEALQRKVELEKIIREGNIALKSLDPEINVLQYQEISTGIEEAKKELEIAKKNFSQAKNRMAKHEEAMRVPQNQYNALVKQVIKKETMKDLVKIAQTGVGRDLLESIAKTSLKNNEKKVIINAFSQYRNPTAAEGEKNPYVDYTPQYFKDRDTQQRQKGGAIRQFEALKAHNPWQENDRTDITLFHELVHAYHFQSGAEEKNNLVTKSETVHAVDRPYEFEGEQRGVREEEYATVGLGKYSSDKYTENAYRAERRDLGESVSKRKMYNHKDKKGKRAI
jgi:Domain of unknown function (DUF4157)/Effector protein